MSDYPRGSEWGKWDLHAHTPIDPDWTNKPSLGTEQQKKKFAKDYIKFAKSRDLKLIAITDHNFCNNIGDLLIPYIQTEAKQENISILPGFEVTAKDGSGVHLLVIFGENTSLELIKSIVNQCFAAGTTLVSDNIHVSTKSIDEIQSIISASKTEAIFIFAHADRENGILHQQTIQGERRVKEWKNDHVQICHISKPPSEYDSGTFYYNVINKLDDNYKRDIAYIVCSDCRNILPQDHSEERFSLGEKYVWVKANPTFNGLKQIIYESQERVRYPGADPNFEYNKPYFDEIEISEEVPIFESWENQTFFKKNTIPLNKNLVAIIGGRGSGKSMLVNYIADIFGMNQTTSDFFSKSDNFKITYAKNNVEHPDKEVFAGNNENAVEYIYIKQSELKNFSDKKEIGRHIKNLLNLEDLYFPVELDQKINTTLKNICDISDWFKRLDENGNPINDKIFIERYKNQNDKLLKNITTKNNRAKLEKYTKNIDSVRSLELFRQDLTEFKLHLNENAKDDNQKINSINKLISKYTSLSEIPNISITEQIKTIDKNILEISSKIKGIKSENDDIKKEFVQSGYSGDLTSLLENADKYQTNIKKADIKLAQIKKQEDLLDASIKVRTTLAQEISDEYENQKKQIDKAWENVLDGKDPEQKDLIKEILLQEDKIVIQGEIIFDKDAFYDKLLESYVDKRCIKDEKTAVSELLIDDYGSYITFLKERIKDYIPGGEKAYFFKQDVSKLFYDLQSRKEYLYTSPKITYHGRPLDKTSVGQRGTVYLCLKLATDAFSKPIIFDQPEDDLDNEFINDELKDIFKRLKKYRQIIIVTHNANLAINADAEQIIVASNESEKLNYFSGALEHEEIVARACEILEGGKDAFQKRENRYGIVS